ncbi:hypothetical protein GIB67_026413 [Kingdonia uniflora]|uniref:Uncharacterized protein n=1 Tax=Kingdonia uniflora TaxID=39325 RepID=A0A7J7P660_9MAGN|nr:hypothetical protein GIB67_026413 [Kingdonia uniflora]
MAQNRRTKQNILVTGTSGTGKTTMSFLLADAAQLRHINVGDVVKEKNLYDGWDENLECHFINEDLQAIFIKGLEGTLQPDPFYALLEASRFATHWLPFCKIFNMEPRAPEVYFAEKSEPHNDRHICPYVVHIRALAVVALMWLISLDFVHVFPSQQRKVKGTQWKSGFHKL